LLNNGKVTKTLQQLAKKYWKSKKENCFLRGQLWGFITREQLYIW
jgi:hypothetical protein